LAPAVHPTAAEICGRSVNGARNSSAKNMGLAPGMQPARVRSAPPPPLTDTGSHFDGPAETTPPMVSSGDWTPAGLNWFPKETMVTGRRKVTTAALSGGKGRKLPAGGAVGDAAWAITKKVFSTPVVTGLAATRGSCASGARRRNTSARMSAGVRRSASGNASGTGSGHAPVERNPARRDVSR
jgi:hypothetical protein